MDTPRKVVPCGPSLGAAFAYAQQAPRPQPSSWAVSKRLIPVANYEGSYSLTERQLVEWGTLDLLIGFPRVMISRNRRTFCRRGLKKPV